MSTRLQRLISKRSIVPDTIHAAWPASAGTERSDAPALRLANAAVDARDAICMNHPSIGRNDGLPSKLLPLQVHGSDV